MNITKENFEILTQSLANNPEQIPALFSVLIAMLDNVYQGLEIAIQKNCPIVNIKLNKLTEMYPDINALLQAVRPALNHHGIAVVQGASVSVSDAACTLVSVVTRLNHTSGEWMESTCYVKAKDTSAWSIGSAISHARRYGLQGMTACHSVGENVDDDGATAQLGDAQMEALDTPSNE